jgi:16S rRNA G527 N7-methylase RsmG
VKPRRAVWKSAYRALSRPRSFTGRDKAKPRTPNDQAEAKIAQRVRAFVGNRLTIFSSSSERELFLERIARMAALIALWGARINLTAAPGDPREIGFHIIDSLAPMSLATADVSLRDAFDAGSRILDLGSGAGFPGLVLASASSARFTLLEGRRKRASFLAVAAADMSLNNVTVWSRFMIPRCSIASRASDHERARCLFDVVTGRAYSSPSAFQSAAASALRAGGMAILYANPAQGLSLSTAEENGLVDFRRVHYAISRSDRKVERILALWRRQ